MDGHHLGTLGKAPLPSQLRTTSPDDIPPPSPARELLPALGHAPVDWQLRGLRSLPASTGHLSMGKYCERNKQHQQHLTRATSSLHYVLVLLWTSCGTLRIRRTNYNFVHISYTLNNLAETQTLPY